MSLAGFWLPRAELKLHVLFKAVFDLTNMNPDSDIFRFSESVHLLCQSKSGFTVNLSPDLANQIWPKVPF